MSIASQITRLQDAKVALKVAIESKGVAVPAEATLDDYASLVDDIEQGDVPSIPEKDVNFYDYDGTVVASYTADEFLELTSMPTNPTHSGLTSQGWNWTLADAQEYVHKYGMLDVGQMYITSDGKTKIYITLIAGRTTPQLAICPNGSVAIDWGDGSPEDVITGSSTTTRVFTSHSYATHGDYVIEIEPLDDATIGFYGYDTGPLETFQYTNCIKHIRLGRNVVLGKNSFAQASDLRTITMPGYITSLGESVCNKCVSLRALIIPINTATLGKTAFFQCYDLEIISLPLLLNSIGIQCMNTTSLRRSIIPPGITNIPEAMLFMNVKMLCVVMPDSITSIDKAAFPYCYTIKDIYCYAENPPSLGQSSFDSTPTDSTIYVPAASVDAYKQASGWSGVAGRIKPIIKDFTLDASKLDSGYKLK